MKELFNLGYHTKMVISILIIFILFIVFYIIKNFRTIDFQLKIILLIIIVGLIASILSKKEQDEQVTVLKNNFSLTTGSIETYNITNLKGKGDIGNSIKYIYSVDEQYFVNSYGENYYVKIPQDKPVLSILYLVIYEKTNPKNSFILLNYPITSPEDFERYKEMFKDKIPANAIKQD